jgi:hypothetical protein
MDIRYAPRPMQEQAYEMALIPFIPGDEKEPEPQSRPETKIIEFPSRRSGASRSKSQPTQKDD